MRVVLDNNVLVSAAFSAGGIPRGVYSAWRSDRFQLVVSAALLAELPRVLAYPRIRARTQWSAAEDEEYLALLRLGCLEVAPDTLPAISRDAADNHVLAAAAAAGADYIVTGDRDLLVLEQFAGIPIVTPVRFLTILAAE